MKNSSYILTTVVLATVSLLLGSCEDEVSSIGSSISPTEITISVDSVTYNLNARTIKAPSFESKSAYTLLGNISVPEYGDLSCSYVTQFLPSEKLNIPDSISYEDVDSVKLFINVPKNAITGDSLATQQFKAYSLIKDLPSDISSTFNPEGYYNPDSPLTVKSYNLNGETFTDSTYLTSSLMRIKANLPVEIGRDAFKAYREDPEIFIWPQKFAKLWPGIYVEPTFGKGCIAAISSTSIYAYFPKTETRYDTNDEGVTTTYYVTVPDSVCMFMSAPEVVSSVNIDYRPSANIEGLAASGKSIITTPGGYAVSFNFPAKEILKEYWGKNYELGVVNNLLFTIPAKVISNKYGIDVPPALLMVKTSELENFFADGKVPDNKIAFYSNYNSDTKSYEFSSMRDYIVDLKAKGEENITEEDLDFTLVPVSIKIETYTNRYTGETVTVVVSVLPYIEKPSMVELETDNARIVFTYSNQVVN